MPFFLKDIELTDRAICEPSSFKRLTKSSLDMQLNDPLRHISKPSNSLDVLEEDSLDHGLLYKWTELLYLTCPHEADLSTLVRSQKLTQYV